MKTSLTYTGVVEPGEYRLNDFAAIGPELRGPPRIPGVAMSEPVYIHLPTSEIWSAAMVDAIFVPVSATRIDVAAVIVRVDARLNFKRRRGGRHGY